MYTYVYMSRSCHKIEETIKCHRYPSMIVPCLFFSVHDPKFGSDTVSILCSNHKFDTCTEGIEAPIVSVRRCSSEFGKLKSTIYWLPLLQTGESRVFLFEIRALPGCAYSFWWNVFLWYEWNSFWVVFPHRCIISTVIAMFYPTLLLYFSSSPLLANESKSQSTCLLLP